MQPFKVMQPVRRYPTWTIVVVGILALSARLTLFPYVSGDSKIFLLPWMQEFRDNGAAALGGQFSNYNFPYLFLMFLGSLLPLEPLFAIKLVSLAGDCMLALSVGALVAQFPTARLLPVTAAVVALFLPTVLLNASMWGQCDAIYTSFLIMSLRSLMRNDRHGAWSWWAIALSFKLQAVFFLPALALIALRNRHSPRLPAMAVVIWILLSIPPVLFGRSLSSTFSIYFHQTQEDRLAAGAANIYAWFPGTTAAEGKFPAIAICASVLLLAARAYWRGRDSRERQVLLVVTVLAVCPLLLPQMHDRYFFAAEVTSLLLLRHKRLFPVPWVFSATGLFVYVLYFLNNQFVWPLLLASIVQCWAVGRLLLALWRTGRAAPTRVAATSP
ncbi:hypothetical protein [Pseudarthrobacter sp. TAF60_1]|uniref:hypothetical protein n=1 Tax=Pseudarthrobacter sp. TAF60_1 TaxID=3233071 RepID=UPI003F965DBF